MVRDQTAPGNHHHNLGASSCKSPLGKSEIAGCGSKPMIPCWLVGEFTAHFSTYFSGWIGMFTGGTIWLLTRRGPTSKTQRRRDQALDIGVAS